MGTRAARYPTAQELRHLSNQELADRKLTALPSASFGTADTRVK